MNDAKRIGLIRNQTNEFSGVNEVGSERNSGNRGKGHESEEMIMKRYVFHVYS
jgi:hypothetical protein